MPRELKVEKLNKKFCNVTKSKDSIQSLSSWIISHKVSRHEIVQYWLKAVEKADIGHRLTLFYVANDVLQNCKRRGAVEFRTSFSEVLEDAFKFAKDKDIKDEALRMVAIWGERNVFNPTFLKALEDQVNKNDAPLIKICEETPKPTDSELLENFQLDDLFSRLRNVSQPPRDYAEEFDGGDTLSESEISQVNFLDIRISPNMSQMYTKLEATEKVLEECIQEMEDEIAEEKMALKTLEIGKLFYTKQNDDARHVTQAYRIFARKLNNVREALAKKKSTLPSSDEMPTLSPTDIMIIGVKDAKQSRKEASESKQGVKTVQIPLSTKILDPKQDKKKLLLSSSSATAEPKSKRLSPKVTVAEMGPCVKDIQSPVNAALTDSKQSLKGKQTVIPVTKEPKQREKNKGLSLNTTAGKSNENNKNIEQFSNDESRTVTKSLLPPNAEAIEPKRQKMTKIETNGVKKCDVDQIQEKSATTSIDNEQKNIEVKGKGSSPPTHAEEDEEEEEMDIVKMESLPEESSFLSAELQTDNTESITGTPKSDISSEQKEGIIDSKSEHGAIADTSVDVNCTKSPVKPSLNVESEEQPTVKDSKSSISSEHLKPVIEKTTVKTEMPSEHNAVEGKDVEMEVSAKDSLVESKPADLSENSCAAKVSKIQLSTEQCLLKSMKLMELLLSKKDTEKKKAAVSNQKEPFPLPSVLRILSQSLNANSVKNSPKDDICKEEEEEKVNTSEQYHSFEIGDNKYHVKSPKVDSNLELMDMDLDSEDEN